MRNCSKKDLVDKILTYKDVTEIKRKKAEQKLQEKKQIQEQRHAELITSRQVQISNPPPSEERMEMKMEMKQQASDSEEIDGMQM